jgi:hypothetical protein
MTSCVYVGGVVQGLAVNTTLEELYLDRNVIADEGTCVDYPEAVSDHLCSFRGCFPGHGCCWQPNVSIAHLGPYPQPVYFNRTSYRCTHPIL